MGHDTVGAAVPPFALDLQQKEIRDLLELIGPEPAAYFADACRIMSGAAGVATQTHLAAHLLREIESRLHEVFDEMFPKERNSGGSEAEEEGESHRAKIQAAAASLGLDEPAGKAWADYAVRLSKFAHRATLAGPRDVAEFRERFSDGQSVLVAVLRQLRAVYGEARPRALALAGETLPTRASLTTLKNQIPHSPVVLGEFFSQANLAWFPLLRRAEYFDRAEPLRVEEDGRVRYVEWPPGRFLVRAAKAEALQSDVLEILNALETDNPEARDATVESALALPPHLAAQLSAKIATYVSGPENLWAPRHADELVVHLVEGQEIEAALRVVKPLLANQPHTADWRMRLAFTDLVPKLFPAAGVYGLAVLRDMLAEDLSEEGRDGPNDLSTIWRETIGGGRDFQRRDLLVTALKTAADVLVVSGTASLSDVVAALTSDERAVFTRLALHVMALHSAPEISAEWLGNEAVFYDHNFEREYAELALTAFPTLDPDVRRRVLGWVDAGPVWRRRDLEEGELTDYDDMWRMRRLRALPDLPAEWKQRFDQFVERFGDPGDPLRSSRFATWSGTGSPISKADLLARDDAALLEFLDTWKPDDEWHGPSREGLTGELRDAATEAPARFSELLPEFGEREPTYARHIVFGLQHVVSNGGTITWAPVLRFGHEILGLPGIYDGRDPAGFDIDPGWAWSRLELCRLIVYGLARRAIPIELADDVWRILAALADDDELTIESEDASEAGGATPETHALAAVRSTAIEGVIHFCQVSRNAEGDGEWVLPRDAREILDRHLDPDHERTRTVAVVFGQHFNQLYSLDPAWATEHVGQVFPDAPEDRARRDAAWRAFLSRNNFWTGTWDVLEPHYRRAVNELAVEEDEDEALDDSSAALLIHIVCAYLNDLADLSDASIIGQFFATAPIQVRAKLFELIGFDISGEQEIHAEVKEKLRRLWEWRVDQVIADGAPAELSAFGWWFGSGVFDARWSLEQLARVLEAGGGVGSDYVVMKRLGDLAESELPLVVRVMALLVDRAYTPHMVLSGADQFRSVLRAALESGDDALAAKARATISRLYAERHTEFNDLLD